MKKLITLFTFTLFSLLAFGQFDSEVYIDGIRTNQGNNIISCLGNDFIDNEGTGFLGLHGPNGKLNIRLGSKAALIDEVCGSIDARPDLGDLRLYNSDERSVARMFVRNDGGGSVSLTGSSTDVGAVVFGASPTSGSFANFISPVGENCGGPDFLNVRIATVPGNTALGKISVHNQDGVETASLSATTTSASFVTYQVASEGSGRSADVVTALTPVSGPESALYDRGTIQLTNGTANVTFEDYFSEAIDPSDMTVMLTPLSAESKGLAVVEKTATGFRVVELNRGQGNYSFDWEVKSCRKGYENYEVLRPAQKAKDIKEQ